MADQCRCRRAPASRKAQPVTVSPTGLIQRNRRPAAMRLLPMVYAYPAIFDFNKRVALITGASRGLGLAMAEALAEVGATVILNGRDADALKVAAGRMRDRVLKAETSAFDVTDRHVAHAMGKTARSRRGGYLPCIRRGVLHHCTTDRCRWRLECHHVTDIRAPGARVLSIFLADVFKQRASEFNSRTCSVVQALAQACNKCFRPLRGNPFVLSLVHPAYAPLGRPRATGASGVHVERSCGALDDLLRDQHLIDTIEAW